MDKSFRSVSVEGEQILGKNREVRKPSVCFSYMVFHRILLYLVFYIFK